MRKRTRYKDILASEMTSLTFPCLMTGFNVQMFVGS